MEPNRVISDELREEVKEIAMKTFDNGKLHDVDVYFSYDEVGQECIMVTLYFEPNMSSEDFKGRFDTLPYDISEACYREHTDVWPLLEFKTADIAA